MKLIDKDALVAEIEKRKGMCDNHYGDYWNGCYNTFTDILSFINTLEVKEVGIAIPNIDDLFEEDGIDPNSKVAKNFKESYYTALENFKAQKGE